MASKESRGRAVATFGVWLLVFAIGAAVGLSVVSSKVDAEIRTAWGEPVACSVTPEGAGYSEGDFSFQKAEVRCPQFTTKVQMSSEDARKPQVNVWIQNDAIFIAGDWSHGANTKPPISTHWWEILLVGFFPLMAVLSVAVAALFNIWLRRRGAA